MVKKLGALASLFFSANDDVATTLSSSTSRCSTYSMSAAAAASSSSTSSWQWPSCAHHPRTLSFAARRDDHEIIMSSAAAASSTRHQLEYYKTSVMNPAYSTCFLDSPDDDHFTTTSSAPSCVDYMTSGPEPEPPAAEVDDVLIRGIRSSTRLFFEPEATSSIVKPAAAPPFGGGTAMAIDSSDPYGDFRRSMEEMVMSHGGASDDWGWLEEMLGWYLSANGRKTHGLIVGAFVDLLVALSSSSSSSSSCSCFVKLADQ